MNRQVARRNVRRNARNGRYRGGRDGYYRRGRWYNGAPRWRGKRRWHRGHYWRPAYSGWYYWNDYAWIWAPTFGVIVGGAAVASYYYDDPYYDDYYYEEPSDVYAAAYTPWTDSWYAYCARKYRSFEPATGYYTTYSGRRVFCVYRG